MINLSILLFQNSLRGKYRQDNPTMLENSADADLRAARERARKRR